MRFKVELERSAQRFIRMQDRATQKKIIQALSDLPYKGDIKKLRGRENCFRLRIGNIRAIYRIDKGRLIIDVLDIDNRGQIYKK